MWISYRPLLSQACFRPQLERIQRKATQWVCHQLFGQWHTQELGTISPGSCREKYHCLPAPHTRHISLSKLKCTAENWSFPPSLPFACSVSELLSFISFWNSTANVKEIKYQHFFQHFLIICFVARTYAVSKCMLNLENITVQPWDFKKFQGNNQSLSRYYVPATYSVWKPKINTD